jgi:hypothetical protein
MADIKKGSDLITTLRANEKRLKKLERQMAVQRKGSSSVEITPGSRTSATPGVLTSGLTTLDRVTVLTTNRCVIQIVVEVALQTSNAAFAATVHLYDETTNNSIQIFSTNSSTGARRKRIVPGSTIGAPEGAVFGPLGGTFAFPIPDQWGPDSAGPHSFYLFYACEGGATVTAFDRKMFAWVTPF